MQMDTVTKLSFLWRATPRRKLLDFFLFLWSDILRFLFIPGLSFWLIGCQQEPQGVLPADFNPRIVKAKKIEPASFRKVKTGPVFRRAPGAKRYVTAQPPVFISTKEHYRPVENPPYFPGAGKVIRMDSLPSPSFYESQAVPLPLFSWPERIPAQLSPAGNAPYAVSYLTIKNGLKDNYVAGLQQDKEGRIWISGRGDLGISIWDGFGFTYLVKERSTSTIPGMLTDPAGNIWIGDDARSHGVSFWDGHKFYHLSEEEGMSSNTVFCLLGDRQGNVWLGTKEGVNIWNGKGFLKYSTAQGLSHNWIRCMLEDRQGNIWIGTNRGVNVWNGQKLIRYTTEEGLSSNRISALLEDRQGQIWIGTRDGGLNIWGETGFTRITEADGLSDNQINSLLEDRKGNILIGTGKGGVNVWDGNGIRLLTTEQGLGSNRITSLLQTEDGRLWVGTTDAGVSILDLEGFRDRTPEVRSETSFTCILPAADGRLWIGTNNDGIYVWNGSGYLHYTKPAGLSSDRIRCILETGDGKIWIGTDHGLTVWDGTGFIHYSEKEDLGNGNIFSLLETNAGDIWIGTFDGVIQWNGSEFTHYPEVESFGDGSVLSLLEDSKERIWIGTGGENIFIWDGMGFFRLGEKESYTGRAIFSMVEDEAGNIWMGERKNGLYIWDGHQFVRYTEAEGLKSGRVMSLLADSLSNIWAGNYLGLNRLKKQGTPEVVDLQLFQIKDGLPALRVQSLFLDEQNRFWIQSPKRISFIEYPHLLEDSTKPRVRLRELQPMFDFVDWRQVQEDRLRKGSRMIDQKDYPLAQVAFDSVFRFTNLPAQAVFPYQVDQLTILWEGIHWSAPRQLRYSYFLAGKNKSWSPAVSENQITLRDLDPGTYTFNVRAVGSNNQWSETASYAFTILPPWWQSWWACSAYLILTLGILLGLYRFQLRRKLEKVEVLRLKELDQFKTRFYTNITHEFRTPLTIILGMADKIHSDPSRWLGQGIDMIKRNGQNLLQLVNQLLDLSRLESGKLKLNMEQGDIVPLFRYAIDSFRSYVESKDIRIHFLPEQDEIVMDFDSGKMLDIVFNLLSNAVKFTPSGGDIYLHVEMGEVGNGKIKKWASLPHSTTQLLIFSVNDTGVGISSEQLPYIFDRFYQVDSSDTRLEEGTGIGLAHTRELVRLMSGSINVKSKLGRGTVFQVAIPISREAFPGEVFQSKVFDRKQLTVGRGGVISDTGGIQKTVENHDLPIALIVEDNKDVVKFMASCLEGKYQIIVAYDGQAGIDLATKRIPDVIISDVMMPLKDGFELCDYLKNDERTSHIPIVLLTAKSDEENRLAGLKRGADAYLSKPFNEEELLVRLEKLIALRLKLQKRYAVFSLPAAKKEGYQMEDAFLNKLFSVVEDHLSDSDFDVSRLCRAVNLSRSQVYRKLKALTGKSTTEVIRSYRLHKGKELLTTSNMNISEVAYKVGFTSPAYFTRCFKKEFGIAPSESKK